MKLKLPYEITKLYDTKKNLETEKKEILLKRDYAYPIEENFKAIKKNINVNLGIGLEITWTDWTPTYSAGGSMTFTSVATDIARYCKIDKMVFFVISFSGTTGGTADYKIYFTLPIEPYTDIPLGGYGGGCYIDDGTGNHIAGSWNFDDLTPPTIVVRRYDNANWGLGVARGATVQGFYQID